MFSNRYVELYDKIHSEKNYEFESLQIANIIKSLKLTSDAEILDFGCGTGKHISYLHKSGFRISGYDINLSMIKKATVNNPGLEFYRNVSQIPKRFNFVYSLFDVLSYQIEDSSCDEYLNQLKERVEQPGWIFLDGWHLPGLLQSPPTSRSKSFEHLGKKFTRNVCVASVDKFRITRLEIELSQNESETEKIYETHLMRAFDEEEICGLINKLGGNLISFYDGSDYTIPLSSKSWRFAVLFKIGF